MAHSNFQVSNLHNYTDSIYFICAVDKPIAEFIVILNVYWRAGNCTIGMLQVLESGLFEGNSGKRNPPAGDE